MVIKARQTSRTSWRKSQVFQRDHRNGSSHLLEEVLDERARLVYSDSDNSSVRSLARPSVVPIRRSLRFETIPDTSMFARPSAHSARAQIFTETIDGGLPYLMCVSNKPFFSNAFLEVIFGLFDARSHGRDHILFDLFQPIFDIARGFDFKEFDTFTFGWEHGANFRCHRHSHLHIFTAFRGEFQSIDTFEALA